MRALLDVNVLVALLDPEHVRHVAAYDWFDEPFDGLGLLSADREWLPARDD